MTWQCSRCGKCCLKSPCILAHLRYLMISENAVCPDLIQETDGKYTCRLMQQEEIVRNVMITGHCDYEDVKEQKILTFIDILTEAASQKELVKQYNRLCGTSLSFEDKRHPLIKMIDDTTGYNNPFGNKDSEVLGFIKFVWQDVWCRFLIDGIKVVK